MAALILVSVSVSADNIIYFIVSELVALSIQVLIL